MSMHLVLVVAAVVALNLPATPDNVANSPLVTFRPDRSQFLSTESASGTLTIENTTTSEIGYSPVGGAFLIREPDGSQREDIWVKSISHPIWPSWINAGQSLTVHVGLPGCDAVSDPCTEHIAIKLVLETKTQRLSPIITPEFTYAFVPDPNATFRVDGLRDNRPIVIAPTQTHNTDAVARFLNAEPLDGARGLSGDDAENSAFVGARPIVSIPEPFGTVPESSEYFGGRWEYIGPPSLSLTIAADRSEIFALVGLKKERCQRFGYDCEAVGVVRAVQRARLLARALGVDIRYVSLVTLYPNNSWEGHDTLVPVGVAMTMTGENSATWRHLPTPTPEPSGHVTFGMTLPAPRSSPFTGYRRTPAPDPVPIAVPDDATTVVGLGQISKTFTADLLRVDISIDAIDSNQSSGQKVVDPLFVAAMLREQPNVADAAGQAEGVGQLPGAYELLLKTYDKATVNRLVSMLRKVYGPLPIGLRFNTSPAISNCDSVYTESARTAMKTAVDNAHQARHRLRRLLLAVAYPLESQQCEQGAQVNADEVATYTDHLQLPTDRTVMVGARVKLVFRTYK